MTIYHPGLGHISNAIEEAMSKATEEDQRLKMCFNGTTVMVYPNDDSDEIYNRWFFARKNYQSTQDSKHPALCPECAVKE